MTSDLLVERLLRVIDEGRRTHRRAVALTGGTDEVPTRLIAEQVAALYYPQTRAQVGVRHAGGPHWRTW